MTEQNVVYVAKLHPIIFLGPVVLGCFALFVGIQFVQLKELALGFLVIACAWAATTWINYHFSSLTIEKKRVIFRTGILVRKTTDIPFTKIETVDIRQTVFGSILRYGMLMITGTGGTRHF